jgi:hypothetical protein
MAMNNKPQALLLLDSARGVYIPRDFALSVKHVKNVDKEDWEAIAMGPDHLAYWEAWDQILNSAVVTDAYGNEYTLHQDNDLWLIPVGMEWSDEEEFYVWPTTPQHTGELKHEAR